MITDREIESDSEESDQQEEEARIQTISSEGRPREGRGRRMVNIFLLFSAVLLVLYALDSRERKQTPIPTQKTANNSTKAVQERQKPAVVNLIDQKKEEAIETNIIPILPNVPPIAPKETLSLPNLDQTKQIGDAHFLWGQLQAGTMHWYTRREVSCQPDIIINSAARLQQGLYLQKTAYTNIVLLYPTVAIPAENIYQFEAVRQFIANLSKNAQNTMAYCHSSPLLLMLAAVEASRGLYACNQTNWQLFQASLIINDLFPLAKPYPLQKILKSEGYNILISDDFSLLKTLLFDQKRQLVLIMEITVPTSVQTYILLKIKAYRLDKVNECEPKKAELYEESGWHVDNKAVLMPGWYAFTTESYPLPITYQTRNYQSPLYSPRKLICIDEEDFKPFSQAINQEYVIEKVPYEGLHLLKIKGDNEIDRQHYRQIFHYFHENQVKSLYLHSGSYYLMTLLISTMPEYGKIAVQPTYGDLSRLKKNLVINNIQVNLLDPSKMNMRQCELVITTSLKEVIKSSPQGILLIHEKGQRQDPNYISKIFGPQQQCNKTSLISSMMVPKYQPAGKCYLLSRIA